MIFAGTMAEMTYPEVERAAARGAAVLFPVGVVEQHGPHLPLGTDVYGACVLCRLARRRMEELGDEALIAPPMYWGVNHVSSAFAGTFRTRPEVFAQVLSDGLDSLATDGFRDVVLVNHHGDAAHNRVLLDVASGRDGVRFADSGTMIERLGRSPAWLRYEVDLSGIPHSGVLGVHAEETETALIARWHPELVRYDELSRLSPTELSREDLEKWRRGGEHARRVTPQGYFGAPAPAGYDAWRVYERRGRALGEAIHTWRAER